MGKMGRKQCENKFIRYISLRFCFPWQKQGKHKKKCINVGTKWINTTQNIFPRFFAYWYISPTDIQIRSLHFRLCFAKPEVKSLNMGVYRLTTLWNRLTSWYRRRGKNKPKMPHLFCLSKGVRLCEQQPFFFVPTDRLFRQLIHFIPNIFLIFVFIFSYSVIVKKLIRYTIYKNFFCL